MNETQPLSVIVAMLTFQRPDELAAALPAIVSQLDTLSVAASVLVVDNDPAGSAMPRAGEVAPDRVRFVHEPVPGIAAARNRAIDESADADLLVFIDDDEQPQPDWLRLLVETWQLTKPAAVVGRVVSSFPTQPEDWISEGGFFERRRLPTGTEIDTAATNNLLLDLRQVLTSGVRFDMRFGISGGSDTLFTRELRAAGGRLVWCDEAVVVDGVPPSRLNRRWVLLRSYRYGNVTSRVSLVLERQRVRRLVLRLELTARGLARIIVGASRLVLGVVARSVRHRARGARTLVRGVGMVSGAWGFTYVEYRRRRRSP